MRSIHRVPVCGGYLLLLLLSCRSATSFQPTATNTIRRSGASVPTIHDSRSRNHAFSGVESKPLVLSRPRTDVRLTAKPPSSSGDDPQQASGLFQSPLPFAGIAAAYWYLLVFGAAAAASGLPVPEFIPMVPGWPPSDADLVPVIEDSVHFFYLSDLLNAVSGEAPPAEHLPQLRLAFFNLAEAWVFCFLPLLLADQKRLPLPVVLVTWFGALGLTNAFLAPYLTARQVFANGSSNETDNDTSIDSRVLKVAVGGMASLVIGYAGLQTGLTTASSPGEWSELATLVTTDRTYLAFAVDLVLFSVFQSFLLTEIQSQQETSKREGGPPLVGLLAWLFRS